LIRLSVPSGNRSQVERAGAIRLWFLTVMPKPNSYGIGGRVRGTGAFSRNNDPRYNNGQSRNFSYEAIVNNRNRSRNSNGNLSGVRYDWRGYWSGNGRDNDRYGDGGYRARSIYCASDDGRRYICPINTSSGVVRLVNQRSESACVEGRTWDINRNSIWVDRGCHADFEVGRGRGDGAYGRGNDRCDNNGGYGNVNRPNGRVSYSGPIMNRHSDKALDVTEQGMQDGANVQLWAYANQANQQWRLRRYPGKFKGKNSEA
jgi:DUF3011 family protein/ricin-type beta-trefoil lectin protein